MTEMILERAILPEPIFSNIGTDKVIMRVEYGGIWLSPFARENNLHPRDKKPFTVEDFEAPSIKTQGWVFNREEANER